VTRQFPAKFVPAGIALRKERAEDQPFLRALFVSIRWPEFEPAGWPDEVRTEFLAGQFILQYRYYAKVYSGGEFMIVEKSGLPVGRLYLFEGEDDLRIVDISLTTEERGRGLGTALLNGVQARAQASGRRVTIHVERNNPAHRLYRRLGFELVEEKGPYVLMEWRGGIAA
jgi:ribosomal protein S18 acetylase RimI-like enzyme